MTSPSDATAISARAARWYGLAADATAVTHALFVGFVVWAEVLILIGTFADWEWIYNLPLRGIHLGLVLFVGVQDLLGKICPLTIWENRFRQQAGQTVSHTPFIGRMVHKVLMCHLSAETQRRIRLVWAGAVVITFIVIPPHW